MSREELHDLFQSMAEDISAPQLVAAAVAQAAHVRRRRRVVASAALAVVAIAAGAVVVVRQNTNLPSPPAASPSATIEPSAGSTPPDRLPAALARDPQAAPYWPTSLDVPANTPSLTNAPISHAVLLYSPPAPGALDAEHAPPIYVYGEGRAKGESGNGEFRWARLPVSLTATRDAAGNTAMPLDAGSLGPMGRLAAFAQPGAVVIYNLITGATDRIPLSGLNEEASWLTDGRHLLVSSATNNWLVDTQTRETVPAAAHAASTTPLVGGGGGLTALTVTGSGLQAPVLRVYADDSGLAEGKQNTVDTWEVPGYRIASLSPLGWRYGHLIAQGATRPDGAAFIAVIDSAYGAVTRVLDLSSQRAQGCCTVLGWMNSTTVLVRTAQQGLLAWQLETGLVQQLTSPAAGPVSVAPTGCDWSVKIAGVTGMCIT